MVQKNLKVLIVSTMVHSLVISGTGAMLGGWAPGMQPIELPEGVGILIQPDDYIIIQMHYYKGENPKEQPINRDTPFVQPIKLNM